MTYNEIQGWCNFEDLYEDIARNLPTNAKIVEIGSWRGKSAVFMADMLKKYNKNVRLICVDTWEGTPDHPKQQGIIKNLNTNLFEDFMVNIMATNSQNYIYPMRMTSKEAASSFGSKTLDFVFIDADHSYNSVKEDIYSWLQKVKPGGILAGHDYDQVTVKKAVNELLPDAKPVSKTSWKYIIKD